MLFGNCLLSLFKSRGWSFVGKSRLFDGGWSWASKQIEGERRGRGWGGEEREGGGGEGEGGGREGAGEKEGEKGEGALNLLFPLYPPCSLPGSGPAPRPHFTDGEAEAGHSLPPPAPQAFLSSQALSPRAAHCPNRNRPTSQRADRRAGDALPPPPTPDTPAPPPPSSPPSLVVQGAKGTWPVCGGLPGRAAPRPHSIHGLVPLRYQRVLGGWSSSWHVPCQAFQKREGFQTDLSWVTAFSSDFIDLHDSLFIFFDLKSGAPWMG